MDVMQALMTNMNTEVMKEPRGFMKALQFLFTICAFATTTSFSTNLSLLAQCLGNATESVTIPIEYSFKLYEQKAQLCNQSLLFRQDFSSDSGFFVAVGLIALSYTIAMLIIYCFRTEIYEQNSLLPLADCVVHGIFTVLFLASSSAWANSLNGLKSATLLPTIIAENPSVCGTGSCQITDYPNYSKLNISIIFGFLNMFLFAANIWFLYKETAIFKDKQVQAEQSEAQPNV